MADNHPIDSILEGEHLPEEVRDELLLAVIGPLVAVEAQDREGNQE